MKHDAHCDNCGNNGIERAYLATREDGQREVVVECCESESHSSSKLAEKSVEGIVSVGLEVRVL
jgi:hypothetical protein